MTNDEYIKYFARNVARLERKYLKLFAKAFKADLKELSKGLALANNEIEALALAQTFNLESANELFKKMYFEAGNKFYKRVQKNLRPRKFEEFENFVNDFMTTYAGEKIVSINETTRKRIVTILRKAFDDGLSIPNTVKLFNSLIADIATKRAVVIARTEIIGAANYGSYEGALNIAREFPEVRIKKTWFTNIDGRERAAHRSANGQRAEIDGVFIVQGEQMRRPHDPSGSASNVIQCRCTLLYERTNDLN